MRSARGSSRLVLLFVTVLCSAAVVCAQDLEVSPIGWNFGNVTVGSPETVTFDLLAGPPSAVWIYVIGLHGAPILTGLEGLDADPHYGVWSLGAFSLNPEVYPIIPVEHAVGLHAPVEVIFTPPSPGSYNAWLYIFSNDSIDGPGMHAFLPLEGTGVPEVVPLPGAALLGAIGLSCAGGFLRRRRTS